MKTLLTLGHGYTCAALAARLIPLGWTVIGTARDARRAAAMQAAGVEALLWPCDLGSALARASHVLGSAAPDEAGDPFLRLARDQLGTAPLAWLGYLSTTAVYGDRQGGWVDETTPPAPQSGRATHRVFAESQWLSMPQPAHIFRLAGIYGPGRGPFAKVREGSARRIIKPGQVFSRIHVEDIVSTVFASMVQPNPGRIYNVCDDDAAPPEDVLSFAATLLNLPLPPTVSFEQAEMTPMARSFYAESKRVRNARIKDELSVVLRFPSYRDGLAALLKAETTD